MQRPALQAGGRTLRHARGRTDLRRASNPLGNRRYASPLSWVTEKLKARFLEPKVMAAPDAKALQAAKVEAEKRKEVNVFDAEQVEAPTEAKAEKTRRIRKRHEHLFGTANFKISHRKLNDIGRQIAGKPIDHAILQMQFSEKRASTRVMNMLVTARDHAVRYKRMEARKLVVAESWVSKGPHNRKRVEPKGRGRTGVQTHPMARLRVVLKEGHTLQEQKAKEKAYKLNKIVSAAVAREDKPIRNPGAHWAW